MRFFKKGQIAIDQLVIWGLAILGLVLLVLFILSQKTHLLDNIASYLKNLLRFG
jgi:hypothetical protein